MKVLQINEVCGIGSTGSICKDIAILSNEMGIENVIVYGQGSSNYPKSFKFGYRIENLIHSLLFTRILGLHGWGSFFGTMQLLRFMDNYKPDVVHLHNLHTNYLNFSLLFNYLIKNDIPVVFTLHDCYNFTGQCEHYVGVGCSKWQQECGNCPFIHKTIAASWFFDWSRYLLKRKKSWYSAIKKLHVVAVSKWLCEDATKSVLAVNGHDVSYIYNWIDTTIFYPRSNKEIADIRAKYGLKSNIKYVLTVGAGWKAGTTKYNDVINLAEELPRGYKLLLVGGIAKGTFLPDSITHIPFTDNPAELAAIYTLAESYVHLSVCDTFGKVIAEAMACGTKPIVYDSTACPEVSGEFGYILEPHDINGIVHSLISLENNIENNTKMIEFVKHNFNKTSCICDYIAVYESLKK